MWKYLSKEHILGRGLDYFIRNLIENLHVKDNKIEATVYGTEEYMEDYIEQILFENFREEEFMENKLIYLEDKTKEYKEKNSWITSYKLGELILRRIKILEEINIS